MVMVCEHAARVARSGQPVRRAFATREALEVIEEHDLPWPDDVRAFYSQDGGWIGPVILAEDMSGKPLIYSALLP